MTITTYLDFEDDSVALTTTDGSHVPPTAHEKIHVGDDVHRPLNPVLQAEVRVPLQTENNWVQLPDIEKKQKTSIHSIEIYL